MIDRPRRKAQHAGGRMKLAVSDVASVVLAGCALILTGMVVGRQILKPNRDFPIHPEWAPISPSVDPAAAGHTLGPAGALVTIVEFADFQCPFCARSEEPLREVLDKYRSRIRLVYRHYPLETIHPRARAAALASECAAAQGRFFEYHDALFSLQDSIGLLSWAAIAQRAGIPSVTDFRECVQTRRYAPIIERDVRAAGALGITATPTFIVANEMHEGAIPFATLDSEVQVQFRRVH